MKTACKMIVLCAACACMCMAADSSAASTAQPGGQDMNADSGLTWYQVLMVASLLGGGTALGWQGCKKMHAIRVEPQPLEVKQSAEYVTKHEFESYKDEVAKNFDRVHQRLDAVMPAVAEIKGEMHRMAVVQEKILGLFLNRKVSE